MWIECLQYSIINKTTNKSLPLIFLLNGNRFATLQYLKAQLSRLKFVIYFKILHYIRKFHF